MESHNEIVERLLREFNSDLIPKNDVDSHAEVFDKHPITAMSEIDSNNTDRVLIITDSWKPEWCKDGVQMPVHGISEQKKPQIKTVVYNKRTEKDFVMPEKLIRSTNKHMFDPMKHQRVQEPNEILYEIDPIDCSWIDVTNTERQCLGLPLITENMIEVVFEMLESLCYKRIRTKIREAETEFLEHDENSKCDVCQSLEGEDGNELVFCEDCFICVHQACYGIPKLPSGSWICRHCEKCPNSSSRCVLCPNRGGAMKPVENDEDKWAHLSCAVWIPEVGFGNIDLMEPITRLNCVPQARWNLRCHLCRTSGTGAPIQCSERKCKQAFHVTCAIQNNLLMKQEFQTNNDVKLLAYCKVHTKKYVEPNSDATDVVHGPRDIIELRIQKQKELETTFRSFAAASDLVQPPPEQCPHLEAALRTVPADVLPRLYTYWAARRTSGQCLPLIRAPPRWSQEHSRQRSNNRSTLSAFCRIRYGLDRARLVVDMLVRREKHKAALWSVMSRLSRLQMAKLRSSRLSHPLLREDPSLDADWGILSNVHLDDSVYVNPGRLRDPNIEAVAMRSPGLLRRLRGNDGAKEDVGEGRTVAKVARTAEAVFAIAKEQLVVGGDLKAAILERLRLAEARWRHPVFPLAEVVTHRNVFDQFLIG